MYLFKNNFKILNLKVGIIQKQFFVYWTERYFLIFLFFFYSEVFWVNENYIILFVIKPSFIVQFIMNFHLSFNLIAKKRRIVEFLIYCHILNNTSKRATHVDFLIIKSHNRIISHINYFIVVRGECFVFCLYY